ncbi:copper homeostasis protein CutC [Loktanella sp. S4079]|uniref:copper homeostasis protein CutC n=1 Tax=Loktanella sp. S4079 TaxID=579483 RepID=UPI0005FA4A5C|nr:copper homeostasis protein CutC [Loktanella sp. S4079]KJZ18476.1 hypothetical protein TW80_13620 [Loktanella sp. S4079]
MNKVTLEICVDDADGIATATRGGANRIELCAALALGGLSPSIGLIEIARQSPLPAMAMIRPRAGDFVWNTAERNAQLAEIATVKQAGLAGVVIGASRPDGSLDAHTLAQFVDAAKGLDITVHRAIDLTPDIHQAMQICQELGIKRVLTSGGAQTAMDGIARLRQMAKYGITIMPGGGINADNIGALRNEIPLHEVHASCSVPATKPNNPKISAFGFQPQNARATNLDQIIALRKSLHHLGARTSG